MLKFLLIVVILTGACFFFSSSTWDISLRMLGYDLTFPFAVLILAVFLIWFALYLLKKPFVWIKKFHAWQEKKKQKIKDAFLTRVLNALSNLDQAAYPSLLKDAKALYGSDSQPYLLLKSLLTPNTQTFDELKKDPLTFLAGTRGLIKEAIEQGDMERVRTLLDEIPANQQKTPWVQQARWEIALSQNDWDEALKLLDARKKEYDRKTYNRYRSYLLIKLGKIKEAYNLNPRHPAIALAYAKAYPQKAIAVIRNAWNAHPTWDLYRAYMETLKSEPDNKKTKAVIKLIKKNPRSRLALLACADMSMTTGQWQRAKENLEVYLQSYPLTKQVATMMAQIERAGWHHEDLAHTWENKAIEAEDDSLCSCRQCNHIVADWQVLCPHCNTFGEIFYK